VTEEYWNAKEIVDEKNYELATLQAENERLTEQVDTLENALNHDPGTAHYERKKTAEEIAKFAREYAEHFAGDYKAVIELTADAIRREFIKEIPTSAPTSPTAS
jgi:hypothetical protein